MKDNNTVEAEIVEDEFKAPILKDIKYPVNQTDIDALLKEYAEIPTIDPEADSDLVAEQFDFVLVGHKKFVKARTTIEKIRKELKAPSMEYGKKVDEIAKEFQKKINGVENALFIQRKVVEDNEARKQREAEELEEKRIDTIKSKILDVKNLPLQHFSSSIADITKALESLRVVTSEEYQEFYDEAVENKNYVIAQLQTARDNKILVENAKKIQDESDAKAKADEDERLRLQKTEADKIAKEREDFEREKQEFADKQKAIIEEADRKQAELEADELIKKQEAERLDRERVNKENFETARETAFKELVNCLDLTTTEAENIIDAIIEGNIPYVKWSPDGN